MFFIFILSATRSAENSIDITGSVLAQNALTLRLQHGIVDVEREIEIQLHTRNEPSVILIARSPLLREPIYLPHHHLPRFFASLLSPGGVLAPRSRERARGFAPRALAA
jgi:hypothetical protein